MASLSIAGITKGFEATQVLKGVSLDIRDGEFLTLLGPSGCGKSTLLRILAGLEIQDGGTISIDDRVVDDLHPKKRDVAMVFQSYALYPHMTVRDNISVPLKMRRLSSWQRLPLFGRCLPNSARIRKEIAGEAGKVAKSVGIEHLLDRKPGQLSGGQRQRVAVARAMVRHPAVFLMDEPLSNLDAKLRVQMRAEIKELHRRLGVTFIYVTHDQAEAMTLSDRVAVMLDGELLQVAPPDAIYAEPNDRRVAEFIGSPKINLLDAVVRTPETIDVAGATLPVPTGCEPGTNIVLGIRPEAFHYVDRFAPGTLGARVHLVEHLGSDLFVHCDFPGAGAPLIARLATDRAPSLSIGETVHLGIDASRVLLFRPDGSRLPNREATVTTLRGRA
ncbi:ABC transporter ATP-binding protein [Chelatococcus asaccharovorans]|uniref:Carbohydrate ABC transporter ATP-binding protein (CUT1 family) n=1 Tax=Chelatococcus asaccharovorans TaxID=28210 RepID=A0A2V3TWU1_9HYPH|nr:ABC transporter ATP-binding protein [Chelatococcus asaccharovorans]MBS7705151.1 ABC transporter ATP-binding protein [Chelatococcus asaccharovorans]PXW53647.1 carbohydrate ABC transporter ATP-binding protein (CUT1 family) [Chelatococcus asaccharovorans]